MHYSPEALQRHVSGLLLWQLLCHTPVSRKERGEGRFGSLHMEGIAFETV